MFILLLALIIILGLHCAYSTPYNFQNAQSPYLENFVGQTDPLQGTSKSKLHNNQSDINEYCEYHLEAHDPEVDKILGYCYYDDPPRCNKTDISAIHGCAVENSPDVNPTRLQKNSTFEFFDNSPNPNTSPELNLSVPPPSNAIKNTNTDQSCDNGDVENNCYTCDITKNKDIDKYVLKSSVPPCPDMSLYARKSNLCPCTDMSKYILKSKVPPCKKVNLDEYVKKSDIPGCPTCPRCPKLPKQPDMSKYMLKSECQYNIDQERKKNNMVYQENQDNTVYQEEKAYNQASNRQASNRQASRAPKQINKTDRIIIEQRPVQQCGYTTDGRYYGLYENCKNCNQDPVSTRRPISNSVSS